MEKSDLIKILKVLLFITVVIFIGSLGYFLIEGLRPLDSIYMTVITLTTTGFREIAPLSDTGKIFTIILLLTGMGVVTYSLSTIVSYIASIDFSKRRREKMEKKISNFVGHTIVCGYGRMGEIICKKLEEKGVKFVVIEKKESLIGFLKKTNYHYIEGDAAHDENLIKAGIKNAKVLVSVIDSDADGLYITLAARSFNQELSIIVRANEPNAQKRMTRAGANKVVLPFVMSGIKVAETVINPYAEDFFNIPDPGGDSMDYVQVSDMFVTENSSIIGKELKEIGDKLEGLIIVGIRKKDHSFKFKPRGNYVFEKDDCLIAMGDPENHNRAAKEFNLAFYGLDQQGQFSKAG